ncbi:MAG: glutamine--fructose-6-phosphate aminotransferase, partial [Lachnospiraceae bacterium]|nr:glutamine--fructose-6-phosphate aminotransferase [Lachnospiraceae bacterium]
VFEKELSNVKEVRARGAMVIVVTKEGKKEELEKGMYDEVITVPDEDDLFTPFTAAVILQLIAYFTSYYRGLDVDKPRNLAKSVTVE